MQEKVVHGKKMMILLNYNVSFSVIWLKPHQDFIKRKLNKKIGIEAKNGCFKVCLCVSGKTLHAGACCTLTYFESKETTFLYSSAIQDDKAQ